MCFAPEADLVGGAVIAVIGVDVIRHVRGRREYLALAALPALLAFHQLDEAFVWWGLQGHVSAGLGRATMWIYLVIAFLVLPVYVPAAVFLIEPPGRRRTAMAGLLGVGVVVTSVLLVTLVRGPVTVELRDFHLAYHLGGVATWVVPAYIVATCGAFLFSGQRNLALFGIVNLVVVVGLALFVLSGFASLWCAWAALTSAAFAVHLRLAGPRAENIELLAAI